MSKKPKKNKKSHQNLDQQLEQLQQIADQQTGWNHGYAQETVAELKRLIQQKGDVGRKAKEQLEKLLRIR